MQNVKFIQKLYLRINYVYHPKNDKTGAWAIWFDKVVYIHVKDWQSIINAGTNEL